MIEKSDGEPPFIICLQGRRRYFDEYGAFLGELEKMMERTKAVQAV